jgi:hypothetical protein
VFASPAQATKANSNIVITSLQDEELSATDSTFIYSEALTMTVSGLSRHSGSPVKK